MSTQTALKAAPPAGQSTRMIVDMRYLVKALMKYNASDLHLKAGRPPLFRINGRLIPAKMADLDAAQVERIVMDILSSRHKLELEQKKHVDCSFVVNGLGRFRCNVYYQRNHVAAAVRAIPLTVPTVEQLKIPEVMKEICQRPRGLILVTGATGSGKSTTLASLINYINETSAVHILCIEDPIEYLHRDMKATVTQREVGQDTHSLKDALHAGLRQDPDVIVIGELRDYEMIQAALSAAETGHLVLATLHTNDARGSIDRVIEVFPPEAKNQARIQLSSTLVGVMSQQLIERADGNGRVPACEIMIKSPIIENYILKNELEKIPEAIATSNLYYKMQTMNQSLERLVKAGEISAEQALKATSSHGDLSLALSGLVREEGYQMAGQFHQSPEPPPAPIELEEDKSKGSG